MEGSEYSAEMSSVGSGSYSVGPTSADSLVVRICSWNVAEVNPGKVEGRGLAEWLNPSGVVPSPGVVVIGLQELDMSAKALVQESTKKGGAWEDVLTRTLRNTGDYTLLDCKQLMGLGIYLFTASELVPFIHEVELCRTRTGFFNSFGNKGAVCVRFKYEQKSFCFINAHLAAHQSEVNRRNRDHDRIVNLSLFSTHPQNILSHDSVFWFGDLNYRLEMPRSAVVDSIGSPFKKDLVTKYDQLYSEMKAGNVFSGFTEPEITWDPTYKCVKGLRGGYSSKRSPAYCDRILYATCGGYPNGSMVKIGSKCVVCYTPCSLHEGQYRRSGLKCHSCIGKKSRASKRPPAPYRPSGYLPTTCLGYSDNPDLTMSDHRPIHGLFAVHGVHTS
eukprot:TRINITY_DN7208_c2_g3_i1.p1 TRINITY_DN7208_c2_g3~~TRINITY_DN7208_c2_g3_i1.p1  ORF type:complete len:403 (+),score=32.18 TRINITY_DN7208_c2_g3_i1:49-1209(+)